MSEVILSPEELADEFCRRLDSSGENLSIWKIFYSGVIAGIQRERAIQAVKYQLSEVVDADHPLALNLDPLPWFVYSNGGRRATEEKAAPARAVWRPQPGYNQDHRMYPKGVRP